ncbi:hypothetical protein NFB50_16420 [Yersinia ruckeri]|uniref:hypothetical protein n=1 Tax=Yersinia ruckeri TaxID=29486 RepID=UPI0020BE87F6|nr:hypothetical protein [Yersinia ruckeri]HDL6887640.1 hypothetical protein [Yersinia enterocolitica]MCW6560044.1 hypothetical protein [Yersinia ruckeri]MCW6596079.1 hypothetical protein [Yersinia ruckeri]UZY16918.1 hypothetical protein LNQ37_017570 [Yersinia ruckeri]HDL6900994.1 hypothetical protein [Yersinia enterocolitica]
MTLIRCQKWIEAKKASVSRAINNADQEVAIAEEVHAHYKQSFGVVDVVRYWVLGFFDGFNDRSNR